MSHVLILLTIPKISNSDIIGLDKDREKRANVISIGLRVSPTKIYYAIVQSDGNMFEVLNKSHIIIPAALHIPEQLTFIRTTLISIISEYDVKRASLRISENTARTPSIFRINIEGVIQELFANSTIEKYVCCNIAKVAGILGESRTTIKKYFEGVENFAEIDEWTGISLELRESIVVATAAADI